MNQINNHLHSTVINSGGSGAVAENEIVRPAKVYSNAVARECRKRRFLPVALANWRMAENRHRSCPRRSAGGDWRIAHAIGGSDRSGFEFDSESEACRPCAVVVRACAPRTGCGRRHVVRICPPRFSTVSGRARFARDVGLAEDKRVVDFLHVAFLKERADFVREFFAGRGKDQPGSGGIEPVQQPEPTGRAPGTVRPEIKFAVVVVVSVEQRTVLVAGAVGLRERASGLGEGSEPVGIVRDEADVAAEGRVDQKLSARAVTACRSKM